MTFFLFIKIKTLIFFGRLTKTYELFIANVIECNIMN